MYHAQLKGMDKVFFLHIRDTYSLQTVMSYIDILLYYQEFLILRYLVGIKSGENRIIYHTHQ